MLTRRSALAFAVLSCPALAAAPRRITAWRIRRADGAADSLLLPSAHQPGSGLPPPAPSVFRGRIRLMLESVRDGSDWQEVLRAPRSWSPEAHFSPEELDLLRRAMACADLGASPEMLRPFALALLALAPQAWAAQGRGACPGLPSLPAAEPPPGAEEPARDAWLMDVAVRRGLPVNGIQTTAELFAAAAQLPDAAFLHLLRAELAALRDPVAAARARARLAEMHAAALREDFRALRDLTLASLAPRAEDRPVFARHMLDERNDAMAQRLHAVMLSESVVAAVGAAHFAGPTGLPTLMSRLPGLRVEQVAVPLAG